MSDEEMIVAIVTIVAMTLVALSLLRTLAARWGGRRPAGDDSPRLRAMDDRLARIEQAVDTVAVEVERLAEGQRFTARLLAEREGGAAAREARVLDAH